MSGRESGILAVYRYLDDFVEAIKKIRGREDFNDHELFSPTAYHEVEQAAGLDQTSPVKWFTLTGALTGMVCGFALCLGTDYDWPLVVGGKTAGVYSLPAYVVIGFELTILLGAIATIIGILVCGRLPNPKVQVLDTRVTDDHFAIFVPHVTAQSAQAKLLKDCGAVEVKTVGGHAG